ncbi:MAG: threonine/serine exporter family protein [Desulfobacterales bacterium]
MPPEDQTNDKDFDEACRFIIKLGTMAHGYGPNAVRLESYLSRLTSALGYHGVFRSTPTEMVFTLAKKQGAWQRHHIATIPGTGLDLAKLPEVGTLVDAVVAGRVSVAEAMARLDEIGKRPQPWGVFANALSYAFCGSGFAVLLSGGWWDVLLSALFSLVVYGMVAFSGRFGVRTAEWLPLSSAFVAGALAAMAKGLLPELNIVLVTLAAILILIPGFSISVGIIELVSQRVVSGTANLMNGLVFLVKQFAGAWLGVGLVQLFWSMPTTAGSSVESKWLWLFMPLLIIGLCVVFQTAPKDFFWAVVGCGVAYGGMLVGSAIAGGNLGNLFGTIIAVIFANIWGKVTDRPTSIVLLPAIVLLVSGSIGFRGLAAISAGKTATGE